MSIETESNYSDIPEITETFSIEKEATETEKKTNSIAITSIPPAEDDDMEWEALCAQARASTISEIDWEKTNNPKPVGIFGRFFASVAETVSNCWHEHLIHVVSTPTEDRYIGSCDRHGNKSGYGTCYYANGLKYVGEWERGQRHGQGTMECKGSKYVGGWKNGEMNGEGIYSLTDENLSIRGTWSQGQLPGNRSHLSNPLFLNGVLNKTIFCSEITTMGILVDNLRQKNSTQYAPIIEAFDSAIDSARTTKTKEFAEQVHKDLIDGKSRLISFIAHNHAMLLEIVPKGEFFIFKMYNSGGGLRNHHPKNIDNGRYQTMIQIQVPKTNLNPSIIENFLRVNGRSRSVEEDYQLLTNCEGAVQLKNDESVVWQKPQKGGNCSIESVFAYLKNTLGEQDYHEMRLEFFEDCIREIEKSQDPSALEFLPLLHAKITERKRRNPELEKVRKERLEIKEDASEDLSGHSIPIKDDDTTNFFKAYGTEVFQVMY